MKYKTETILTAIGILLFGILFAGSILLYGNLEGSPDTLELVQSFMEDENINEFSEQQLINYIGYLFIYLSIISFVWIILGAVAIFLLKKENKGKAAGILLIVTAVLGTLSTIGLGIFSGIIYLAAGIMAITRKRVIS
ncbi:DUF4064 domain-containing protein [Oceanobacillus neutriphilus]|uniref:DUF4064 domain-containing protein n=1 Tax=Oceanobacillus neutriphilus TaxID=531815 RepID=A0ABQ2NQ87_9BACI|nr:DUF4064 domain-containing protein [Oceanobacillus neutriphilus]GGP09086.1 hypothetical protein GCM10011346_11730 [Oceanobacillus neutriphilus]